jgi:hypothetical protein
MLVIPRRIFHLLIPLHDPVVICRPFVNVLPAQLLMKLFCDVVDAAWPASDPVSCCPSLKEPLWMALAESVVLSAPALFAFAGEGVA